jgi:hypothetical protein
VNTLKRELTNVTSLQVASLTPGTVDLILGSDFTGLAPQTQQSPQTQQTPATSVTPQASATPTAQPSSGTSPSASGVAGLAQSNGGITAAAACTADSSAFAGPLSP